MRCLVLFLILLPCAALATPPRVITMTDRMVGQSETAVYAERIVSDNLGSHYTTLTDVVLVEIPVDGAPERMIPLRTVMEDFLAAEDAGKPVAVTEIYTGNTDLHSALANAGAAPRQSEYINSEGVAVTLSEGIAEVTLTHDKTRWTLAPLEAATKAWNATRAALPQDRPEGISGGESGADFYVTSCEITQVRPFWLGPDERQPFAQVTCGDLDEAQEVRLWLRLDPA